MLLQSLSTSDQMMENNSHILYDRRSKSVEHFKELKHARVFSPFELKSRTFFFAHDRRTKESTNRLFSLPLAGQTIPSKWTKKNDHRWIDVHSLPQLKPEKSPFFRRKTSILSVGRFDLMMTPKTHGQFFSLKNSGLLSVLMETKLSFV